MGLSLFLPAGSRGKTRWVEETQSYSLKRPKFCLDIGEHLSRQQLSYYFASVLVRIKQGRDKLTCISEGFKEVPVYRKGYVSPILR